MLMTPIDLDALKDAKKNSFMNSKIQIISTLMKSIDLDAVKAKFYSFI